MTDDDVRNPRHPDYQPIAPVDAEAEESLVGAMLLSSDGRRRAFRASTAADLWDPALRAIYRAIEALHAIGSAVDPVTVHERLVLDGETSIPVKRLMEIQGATPASASAGTYAEIVTRYARLRAAVRLGEDLINAGRGRDFDTLDTLVAEAGDRLAPPRIDTDAFDLADLWDLAEREQDDPSKPWVIPGCLRTREVIAYTGSEGLGKSTYLRQIAGCVATGMHPFTGLAEGMVRQRTLYLDLQEDDLDMADEVTKLRSALGSRYERGWYFAVSRPEGLDLLSARGARTLEGLLDRLRPALVVMGPVVKTFRAPDGRSRYGEDVVDELTLVLDDLMVRYDCALILEGHAGNDRGHDEDWRIRGSSVWRSWPAFSHGLKEIGKDPREVDVVRARRDRYSGRVWPTRLYDKGSRRPWSVSNGDYAAILRAMGLHHLLGEAEQQGLPGEVF